MSEDPKGGNNVVELSRLRPPPPQPPPDRARSDRASLNMAFISRAAAMEVIATVHREPRGFDPTT